MTKTLVALAGLILSATTVATQAQATGTTHPARYAPCAYEDGPGPCVWDARHRGNGEGHSFYINRRGTLFLLPHHLAHYVSQ